MWSLGQEVIRCQTTGQDSLPICNHLTGRLLLIHTTTVVRVEGLVEVVRTSPGILVRVDSKPTGLAIPQRLGSQFYCCHLGLAWVADQTVCKQPSKAICGNTPPDISARNSLPPTARGSPACRNISCRPSWSGFFSHSNISGLGLTCRSSCWVCSSVFPTERRVGPAWWRGTPQTPLPTPRMARQSCSFRPRGLEVPTETAIAGSGY